MTSLVVLSYEEGEIRSASRSAIIAASQLGEVHVLLAGEQVTDLAKKAASLEKVSKVLLAEQVCYAHMLAEPMAELLASLADSYEFIIMPANAEGKDILPRLAGKLDVQPITDIVKIVDSNTFVRPIYAGSILATVKSKDSKKLLSIRGTAFEAAEEGKETAIIEQLSDLPVLENLPSTVFSIEISKSDRPELESARVVISGGRGMQSSANFVMLEKIADRLNAAIGASRAAVDAGYISNDYQVGQTGKVVAPELYIAVGISGSIQHLAGMKDSKVIVAINKDPEAPIFKVMDYGIVGDLFEVLPELEKILKEIKAGV